MQVSAALAKGSHPPFCVGDLITVSLLVEDSGIGIPDDKFETIFERLRPAYEGVYAGTGLGLYAVKRYVESMQGEINVQSEQAKGTCFTISLPFTVSDHTDQIERSTCAKTAVVDKPVSFDGMRVSVLVVEDSPLAVIGLQNLLKHCAVEVAKSGAQAIEMAQNRTYDLIFMDIGLSDFSGIEVTKKIRALSDTQKSQVPIVALTGHAHEAEKRQACLSAGMQAVLSKPIGRPELESALKNYVYRAIAQEKSTYGTSTLTDIAVEPRDIIDWEGCVPPA